jgi:hypothetical protein
MPMVCDVACGSDPASPKQPKEPFQHGRSPPKFRTRASAAARAVGQVESGMGAVLGDAHSELLRPNSWKALNFSGVVESSDRVTLSSPRGWRREVRPLPVGSADRQRTMRACIWFARHPWSEEQPATPWASKSASVRSRYEESNDPPSPDPPPKVARDVTIHRVETCHNHENSRNKIERHNTKQHISPAKVTPCVLILSVRNPQRASLR